MIVLKFIINNESTHTAHTLCGSCYWPIAYWQEQFISRLMQKKIWSKNITDGTKFKKKHFKNKSFFFNSTYLLSNIFENYYGDVNLNKEFLSLAHQLQNEESSNETKNLK